MKIMENIAGKLYNKVFGMRCDIRPGIRYFDETHFEGLKKENFSFTNDNNFILRGGFYHYDEYDKDTLVMFLHGIGGGHQAYMKEIDYLCRNGFLVLAIDYQGSVLSDGDTIGCLTEPLKDMSKALSLVKNNYKNIYVIGHSWGGYVAQGLSALHKEINKVVTISGMNGVSTMFDQILKGPLKVLKKYAFKIEEKQCGDLYKLNAMDTLNRSDLKALVIHSRDDKVLLPKFNFDLVKEHNTCKNIQFLEVDHKNHNSNYTVEAVQYLTNYLNELGKTKDKDKIKELESKCDFDKMCEQDPYVMDTIINFLKKA